MSALDVLRDALGRVVAVREALADDDIAYAVELVADLEHDLVGAIARLGVAA